MPEGPELLPTAGTVPTAGDAARTELSTADVASSTTEAAAAARAKQEDRIINTIAFVSILVWGGNMLAMQAEHEVWLRHYAGNFAEQARVQALIQSFSGALSFVVNPILAGFSDSKVARHGR
jgi:hypothetical protein